MGNFLPNRFAFPCQFLQRVPHRLRMHSTPTDRQEQHSECGHSHSKIVQLFPQCSHQVGPCMECCFGAASEPPRQACEASGFSGSAVELHRTNNPRIHWPSACNARANPHHVFYLGRWRIVPGLLRTNPVPVRCSHVHCTPMPCHRHLRPACWCTGSVFLFRGRSRCLGCSRLPALQIPSATPTASYRRAAAPCFQTQCASSRSHSAMALPGQSPGDAHDVGRKIASCSWWPRRQRKRTICRCARDRGEWWRCCLRRSSCPPVFCRECARQHEEAHSYTFQRP